MLTELSSDSAGIMEKHDVQGHDLLSLLIKSKIASNMPASMRMSDSEILSHKHPCPTPSYNPQLNGPIWRYPRSS